MSRSWPSSVVESAAIVVAATVILSVCASALAAIGHSRSQTVTARLAMTADEAVGRGVSVFASRDGGIPHAVAFEIKAGTARDEKVLSFECAAGVYTVQTQDFVSAPIVLDSADACRSQRVVSLLPAARMRGRVSPDGERAPSSAAIRLSLRQCGTGRTAAAIGDYRAAIDRDRSFTVVIPAGCLDIVATRFEMAPIVLPSATYAFRQVRDVGVLVFRPGATISVEVKSADGTATAVAQVSAVSAAGLEAFVRGLTSGAAADPIAETRADDRGRAVLVGVPPGLVYVVARAGGRTGFGGPVDLRGGTMATVDPVVPLGGGIVVCSVATPDPGWIPDGGGLVAVAAPIVDGRWIPAASVRSPMTEGLQSAMRIPFGGRWRFQLLVSAAGLAEAVDVQDADVAEGKEAALQFSVVRTPFDGQVLVGNRSMAGILTLTSVEDGRRYVTAADENGRFRVWMATQGRYGAQFRASHGELWLRGASADFDAGHPATVRFAVFRVDGLVVLSDGTPVAGAVVTAAAAPRADAPKVPGLARATTDERGAFSLDSLESGTWQIVARSGSRASAPQAVNVEEGPPPPQARLVLEEKTRIAGRVVDGAGHPVPLARGRCVVEPASPTDMPQARSFQTDVDGYFAVELDRAGAVGVQLLLIAPGRPVAAFRVAVVGDKPIVLTVPSAGGHCRLVFARPGGESTGALPAEFGDYALFNEQGAILPLREALELRVVTVVPLADSTACEIASLSAGTWRLARFASPVAGLQFLARLGGMPVVREFTVPAGGSVIVDLR